MMLGNTTTQNNGTRLGSSHCQLADFLGISNKVDHKVILEGIGEEDVSNTSVSQCRAEDGNSIFVAPVVYTFFVIDFLAESINNLSRSPGDALLHLFIVHLLEKRQKELFQFDVALIGNQDVSDSAMPIESIFDIVHVKLSQMEGAHAFHQVFLDSTCSCDDAVDHPVLGQISHDISHTAGGHVGSVAQEDRAFCLGPIGRVASFFVIPLIDGLIREPPANHAIDDLNGLLQVGGLETGGGIALEDLLIVDSLVEVVALDDLGLKLLILVEKLLHLLFHVLGADYLGLTTHYVQQLQIASQYNYYLQGNTSSKQGMLLSN